MADGTTLNPGSGGDVIATDDLTTVNGGAVSGVKAQRVKVGFGPDGALDDVTSSNPLPVSAASLPLPSGAATAEHQITSNALLNAIGATLGSPLQAGGSVSILGTVAVSGTFWQPTQPISAASLPLPSGAATAAKQDAIVAALGTPLQAGGSVSISGTVPVTGALTDAQLRASPIQILAPSLPLPSGAASELTLAAINTKLGNPFQAGGNIGNTAFGISGTLPAFAATPTFNLGALNGAALDTSIQTLSAKFGAIGQQAMAASAPVVIASDQSAIPVTTSEVTASGTITTQNLVPAGIATANSAVTITPAGRAGLTIQVTGTYTGALSLQGTVDGNTWVTIGGVPLLNVATGAASSTIASATQGIFQAEIAGYNQVRLTALAAVTGTATVTMRATGSSPSVALDAPLPAGTNSIGTVTLGAAQAIIGYPIRAIGYQDTTTSLGAGATFTGTGRALLNGGGGLAYYVKFNATAYADQAGTLYVEHSIDTGATYHPIASAAVSAGSSAIISVPLCSVASSATLYRVRFVNGGVAQGILRLSSSFTAA